jgi:hypothetical protein
MTVDRECSGMRKSSSNFLRSRMHAQSQLIGATLHGDAP